MGAIDECNDRSAVGDRLRVAAEDFGGRNIVSTSKAAPGDATHVDQRTFRTDEKEPDEIIFLLRLLDKLDLVWRGEDSLENKTASFCETFFAQELRLLRCLKAGFGRIPVSKLVLRDFIGIYIEAILRPCMPEQFLRYGGFAGTIRPGNDYKLGLFAHDGEP